MKSIFFNSEVLNAEKKIISSLHIPSLLLMENAGYNSYLYITEYIKKFSIQNIYLITGKGNNAGDGFVIARHLISTGLNVTVFMLYDENELTGDAQINYEVLKNLFLEYDNIDIKNTPTIKEIKDELINKKSLVIDAVFGVGFKGELESRIADIFKYINSLKTVRVIAVDTVSGLPHYNSGENCIEADVTLSMGVKKFNSIFWEGRIKSGFNEVMNIGIPAEEFDKYNSRKIYEVEKFDLKNFIPIRGIHSNKYSNGKLFVLSGSKGFTGASYLCSLSALKTGCGAVILGIPDSLNNIMEKKLTEVITLPLSQTDEYSFSLKAYKKISERIKWSNCCLIGPGIGRNPETLELVRKIIGEIDYNYVLDADGLFAIKDNLELLNNNKGKIIITPHYGEFANLSGLDIETIKNNIYETSTEFAKKYDVILVLKNSPTVITDGEKFYINPTGRENLATVGSGDVLAGIIASIYAQSKDAVQAALAGVYLHGLCGDLLYDNKNSSSTIASDLIGKISKAKKEIINC